MNCRNCDAPINRVDAAGAIEDFIAAECAKARKEAIAERDAARAEAEQYRREIEGYWKAEVTQADERAETFKAERDRAYAESAQAWKVAVAAEQVIAAWRKSLDTTSIADTARLWNTRQDTLVELAREVDALNGRAS